mmetsp:Transcript_10299/g.12913  ORF Transcript_10299/g.12913 Transcript_10299/m.12913 type:complete len:232 (-) Transcript_10299:159-854(-)|eukprot:CAMPEP_0117773306 /NCGR_PEP_ID=MMETSP0947-20121206/25759_1 /TAXON_ID=44440 /ORGANISM="Chattonella subsalsa, Strain CCMP2191" /LENGTH=231 /DNA_ID=CAMNT_0005599387 /DNA_START=270 /DNA_END=965 /DNA_ORIENTATION=-
MYSLGLILFMFLWKPHNGLLPRHLPHCSSKQLNANCNYLEKWTTVTNFGSSSMSTSPRDSPRFATTRTIDTVDLQNPDQHHSMKPDNFTLNLGKALDTISIDIPNMFIAEPHLDILTEDVVLKDPHGVLAKGKKMYAAVFASLRLMSRLSGSRSDVQMLSLSYEASENLIEARVRMDTFSFFQSHVRLDTICRYKVNSEGLIYEHDFDMHMRDRIMDTGRRRCAGGGILSM